jgi:zinc D-Ala-D-Ala carboxypeptidase
MTCSQPARTATRRIRIRRIRVAGLLVVVAAIAAALGYQLPASSSSTAAPPDDVVPTSRPSPTTIRGVGNLDPALVSALHRAAADAAHHGVDLYVKSGWRSQEYQQQLLREAISKYGSEEEAARWVAAPATSAHVSGDAVDIGPSDAAEWLYQHGAEYGLCQIYGNEPWHYELRPEAIHRGCPPTYADPTHDPRMQQ